MADKKRTEPDWQDVRVFLALGRYGSLSAAARALGTNHSTISRRLQSLEASLGEKLMERRPQGYVLTPAGTQALAAASDMEAAVQTLGRGQADGVPRGLVRVNAPPALTQGFLTAQLAPLPLQYPGLDIELASDLRAVSLERHVTDIAVRLDPPRDGDVIARPLGTMAFGFYGTEAVRARIEAGQAPSFVGFDEANAYLPEATWLAQHFPQARIVFRANNQAAQAIAARSGAGLVLLPHYLGRSTPGLHPCTLPVAPPSRGIFLLTRRQDRRDLPIRTVADHLLQVFADARALFEP
ncbi:LysR family transcriptional regulator [Stenotrophomonas sp. 24(2023)]|uniref:LysR family transcriptional regulator n=1 Tax=Stenotrophomonas sp. 24(2023) TaxID=3068324 RepID=UPI0027E06068|nr:LysR family transcriptional regulator [Stenotrophomonas sp. 24(2023)]WMJ69259.1 LysR family transcriptional regulator [Stenotrophomonas sp. 24(2023)]